MKKILNIIILISLLTIIIPQSQSKRDFTKPKNIIILIGDGMGYNHVKAANYYTEGKDFVQKYESFPVQYAMSTYPARTSDKTDSLHKFAAGYNPLKSWTDFSSLKKYFTDSGAAATAMSTGEKTYYGAIGVNERALSIENISEVAKLHSKSTGVVTSVQISHATPAGFVAHNKSRKNYSEIAIEMLFKSKMDVIIGAGNPDYDENGKLVTNKNKYEYVGTQEIWEGLKKGNTEFIVNGEKLKPNDIDEDGISDQWSLIQKRDEFKKLATGDTPKRLLGIPKVHSTLQQGRDSTSIEVYGDPLIETVPTLAEMTKGALNVLDNNKKGFFVMIEGGAIDWASHSNQLNRTIEEVIDFNKAVDAVINWVETNSSWNETLVIVTADHETGFLWGKDSKENIFNPIVNKGKNNLPEAVFYSTNHTNSLVPFYAKGAGATIFNLFADETDPIRGKFINNTEIAQACFILLSK